MELTVRIKKRLHRFTLNADIETKSSIALLGASGSGKSMTLKCIAGIEKPDSGVIILNGRTFTSAKKKNRLPFPKLCSVSEYDRQAEYRGSGKRKK